MALVVNYELNQMKILSILMGLYVPVDRWRWLMQSHWDDIQIKVAGRGIVRASADAGGSAGIIRPVRPLRSPVDLRLYFMRSAWWWLNGRIVSPERLNRWKASARSKGFISNSRSFIGPWPPPYVNPRKLLYSSNVLFSYLTTFLLCGLLQFATNSHVTTIRLSYFSFRRKLCWLFFFKFHSILMSHWMKIELIPLDL